MTAASGQYIKSVLPAEGGQVTSPLLPGLATGDRRSRVQQQVQLTLARRSRKGSHHLQNTSSPTGSEIWALQKARASPAQAPDWTQYSRLTQSMRQPTRRVEVSPESSPKPRRYATLAYRSYTRGTYTLPVPRPHPAVHTLQSSSMPRLSSAAKQVSLTAGDRNGLQDTSETQVSQQQADGQEFLRQVKGNLVVQDGTEPQQTEAVAVEVTKRKDEKLSLKKAVSQLCQKSPSKQVSAATYIQVQCCNSPQAKKQVLLLRGIPALISLLQSPKEDVQSTAAGALRNIVFEDNDNKWEVKEKGGIPLALTLLKSSRDMETRKHLTGLLWNLSSHDQLKGSLCREALTALTDSIVVPHSGISEGENPKDELLVNEDIFYNTTGCLRNLSSGGPEVLAAMRGCRWLIDALVSYVQRSIADHKPDDPSTENCVCILHNLSYQVVEDLFPTQELQRSVGCFGPRSTKAVKRSDSASPVMVEKSNAHGVELLWSSVSVRMYLSLVACSSRRCTQEAALGALQNLTAYRGQVSLLIADTIVRKQQGLEQMKKKLEEDDDDMRKAVLCLLKNLSRFSDVHEPMVQRILPKLIALLDKNLREDNVTNVCHTLTNLTRANSKNALALANLAALDKIISVSVRVTGDRPTKAGQAASVLLYTLWKHKDLHRAYKKAGHQKSDFINRKTTKAFNCALENNSSRHKPRTHFGILRF